MTFSIIPYNLGSSVKIVKLNYIKIYSTSTTKSTQNYVQFKSTVTPCRTSMDRTA